MTVKKLNNSKKLNDKNNSKKLNNSKKNKNRNIKVFKKLNNKNTYLKRGGAQEEKEYPNGKYIGNIIDGKRDGKGRMYYSDNSKYVGEWKDDKKNGQGILFNADNQVEEKGIWKDDELYESTNFEHREYTPKKNYNNNGKYSWFRFIRPTNQTYS